MWMSCMMKKWCRKNPIKKQRVLCVNVKLHDVQEAKQHIRALARRERKGVSKASETFGIANIPMSSEKESSS